MTIEEFLDENTYNLSPDEYNAALDDSQNMDEASWVAKYAPLMQEKAVGWNKLDAVKKSKPLPERLREAFGKDGFNPGKTYKDDVYQEDFADVKRKDFDKALDKMREYYEQETKQRKAEADKEKRKREVKNWGWRDFIASDYEKERYLDNPQAALFGEQAPSLGKAPETRWGSATDLGMGVAGAAGDVVPGWGSILAGPGIRTARDIGHKVTGSPYQKEWGDIGKGFMQDAAFNAATFAVPNFKRARKVADKVMPQIPDNVTTYKALENEAQNTLVGLNGPFIPIPGTPGTDRWRMSIRDLIDNTQDLSRNERDDLFRKYVSQMPESPSKKALEELTKDNQIDWAKAAAIANNDVQAASYAMSPEMREAYRNTRKDYGPMSHSVLSDKPFYEGQDPAKMAPWYQGPKQYEGIPEQLHPYYRTILSTAEPTAKELKTAKRAATASKLYDQFSSAAVNLPATFFNTRPTGKAPTKVETAEEREEIEAIKEREAPFWDMKFKPKKDNSLMYKAWKEWADENGVEVKD